MINVSVAWALTEDTAAGMVGCFGNPAVLTEDKGIVVVLAGRFCYVKSVPDLKTFDGTDDI